MRLEIQFGTDPPAQTLNRIERFAQFIDCNNRLFVFDCNDREDTIILLRLLWNRSDVSKIQAHASNN